MRQRRDTLARNHLPNDRPVAAMGSHQFVADLVLDLADKGLRRIARDFKKQFASQRVSIGVQAVRGQAEHAISHLHVFAADDAFPFDHSDNESSEIVFAFGIESRHLGRLAANQGAAVMLAGFGEAAHNFLRDFRLQRACG